MRFVRGALIAAMLVGCDADSSDPVQPRLDGVESMTPSSSEESAAVAAGDNISPTRGFFSGGASRVASIGTAFTEITKLSLPAGKYIASVSAVLAASDPEARLADCIFTVGGSVRGELTRGMVGGLGPNNFTTLPHTIGFTTSALTDLGVACRADIAGRVVSQPSHITAIRVDQLTVRP